MASPYGNVSGSNYSTFTNSLNSTFNNLNNNNFNLTNNIPSMARMADANPVSKIASWGNNAANAVSTGIANANDPMQQLLANQKLAIQNQGYNQQFSNWLGAGQLALGAFSGIGSYINGKNYLKLARDQLAQQQNQFNETYNNQLKEYNTALADRLRARAAFETGDSTAYNDEITANSMQRGQTGNSSSDYLNYKRSANADNPYNKDTKKETD